MADPRPQALYNCSQSELYAICTIGWTSYNENQPNFETFNTLYTALYGTDAQAEVDAAMNIPGFQERNEAAEVAHIELTKAHDECLLKWKSLRAYIKSSYPVDVQKPKIEAAGSDHYSKAASRNWDQTILMLTAGQHFIDNNTAELTLGGMPLTFPPEYALASSAFGDLYIQFTDFEQDEQEGTDIKIDANNDIFQKLTRMFEDAQIIYEHDASKRERFIFKQLKEMITNSGGSSTIPPDTVVVEGAVTDLNTGVGISDVSINTTPDGSTETFSAISEADGSFKLKVSGLLVSSTGTLLVNAEALDYEPTSLPLEYATGQAFKLEFQLQELAPPPPPPVP